MAWMVPVTFLPPICFRVKLKSGPWFNIKMPSYPYKIAHCGEKTVVRSSNLHNGSSYTGKMTSLCWIRAQFENVLPEIVEIHVKDV